HSIHDGFRSNPASNTGGAEAITFVYMQSAELHARLDPERNHVLDRWAIVERYRTAGTSRRCGGSDHVRRREIRRGRSDSWKRG
ncbi:MAG TPA: hypothetical protein VEV37_12590, partial [Bryobacteraceae bacterium]|nr:hypothetical protein [Bryobacteraceae bacterium]